MFENVINKNLVFNGTLKKFKKPPTRIILHHSGASANQTVEEINNYHINHNDWIAIGYNFLVDKNGKAYFGRGIEYVGAHCKGYNEVSIGICAIGNMETGEMPAAQKAGIIQLIKEIKEYYPSIVEIDGHRELASTDCPGKYYPLEELKNYNYDSTTASTDAPKPSTPVTNGYLVRVKVNCLNIRKGAGTNYSKAGSITDKGVYTIIETAAGKGSNNGWGRLKSGAGWISLDFVTKL